MEIYEYLQNLTHGQKAEFERVRRLVKQLTPDAEELISYGVPTFKYKKRPLIYFAAFKNHMSIYPVSDDMIEEIGQELAKFRTGKGTLQFTEDNPIPDELIKKFVAHRLKNIDDA